MKKKKSKNKVINPSYYLRGGIQVIDIIHLWELNYPLGTALAYICRAGKKDGSLYREDIKKAIKFLEFSLEWDALEGFKNASHICRC